MSLLGLFESAYRHALAELPEPELLPDRLARASLEALPVDGVGIGVLSTPGMRLPVGASDEESAAAERLQFTVGEGPCLDAFRQSQPLGANESELASRWPALHGQFIEHTSFRSVWSWPLGSSLAGIGAIDFYFRANALDNRSQQRDFAEVVAQVGECLTQSEFNVPAEDGSENTAEPRWLRTPGVARRTNVWVAMGIVNSALSLSAKDSLAVLRGYAFVRDLTVDSVAADLVTGRITFAAFLD